MDEKVTYVRRAGYGWLIVTILLCLALGFVVFELVQKRDREYALLLESISAKERQVVALEDRMAYLRSLLSLSPCEAKAKWKIR